MHHRERWAAWQAVLFKINRHYRYSDPRKALLLKLAAFAQAEMARHNTAYWKEINAPEVLV